MFKDGDFKWYIMHKYHAYFGALFTNVHIDRTLPNGELSARFQVPLHFGDVEQALERVIEDPTINRPDAIVLPAMSWNFKGMKYNGERKMPTRNRFSVPSTTSNSAMSVLHTPAPYDFAYELGILVKNYNDGLKIVENIVPYFQPDYTTSLELIPEFNLVQEIPVVLDAVDLDYEIPQSYKDRASFVIRMGFTLQGYLYGPQKQWPLIKFATVDLSLAPDITVSDFSTNSQVVIVTSTPGLTANGQPTSVANQSINALSISITSDYGFIDTSAENIGNRT